MALETRASAEYRLRAGQLERSKKARMICGLNANHNHHLKYVFVSAASNAVVHPGPMRDFYVRLLEKGVKPSLARLTLARKIAAIALILWKKEEGFQAAKLNPQAA